MKIFDASNTLIKNYQIFKPDRNLVFHWTGKGTVQSVIEWLSTRLKGKGTVGYNYIIDTNGDVYRLCPITAWFHNSGKGTAFDRDTVSIAFLSSGEYPTKQQIKSCNILLETEIYTAVNIVHNFCHSELCAHKPDFPPEYWKKLKHHLHLM